MKRIICILFVANLVFGGISFALLASRGTIGGTDVTPEQSSQTQSAFEQSHAIVVQLPPTIVAQGDHLNHAFTVTNDLAEMVTFDAIHPSCQCTEATLELMQLQPGASTKLNTRIRASNTRPENKSITVRLADSKARQWKYRLDVMVYPLLEIHGDSSVLRAGEFDPDVQPNFVCEVSQFQRAMDDSYSLSVKAADVATDVREKAVRQLSPGVIERRYDVAVLLPSSRREGVHNVELLFSVRSGQEQAEFKQVVQWTVRPRFLVDPPELRFGQVGKQSTEIERSCTIRRRDGLPFKVLDWSTDFADNECVVVPSVISDHEISITVKIDAARLEHSFRRALTLRTDHPDQSELVIWMSGLR